MKQQWTNLAALRTFEILFSCMARHVADEVTFTVKSLRRKVFNWLYLYTLYFYFAQILFRKCHRSPGDILCECSYDPSNFLSEENSIGWNIKMN